MFTTQSSNHYKQANDSPVRGPALPTASFRCGLHYPKILIKRSSCLKPMPKKSTRANSRKRSSSGRKTGKKTRSKTTTRRSGKSSGAAKTSVHRRAEKKIAGTTYVFECTRQGCRYQIVREEKYDTGTLRFDLKCPKCHNREFKCLGPGDLPTPELGASTEQDFSTLAPEGSLDNAGPLNLGTS